MDKTLMDSKEWDWRASVPVVILCVLITIALIPLAVVCYCFRRLRERIQGVSYKLG